MQIKSLTDLTDENYYKIDESALISLGYYTDNDLFDSGDTTNILRKTYKKRASLIGEPTLIIFFNGFILSKIWTEKGRISRSDGFPAEISYDEYGVIDKSWHINGKCINDEISFICLKNNKDKDSITNSDVSYIRKFFKIK